MKEQVIFLGAPGSGKGTQAQKLVEERGFSHLSTGDLLRSEIKKKTPLGLEVEQTLKEGRLVEDETVLRLLQANVKLAEKSYIFDGYPRNIDQAKDLDREILNSAPKKAFYFKMDLESLVERLVNRRTCTECGAIYNLISRPPKVAGVCDQCGANALEQRADDREEVIRKRMQVFEEQTSPMISYYRQQGILKELDAAKNIEKLKAEIEGELM